MRPVFHGVVLLVHMPDGSEVSDDDDWYWNYASRQWVARPKMEDGEGAGQEERDPSGDRDGDVLSVQGQGSAATNEDGSGAEDVPSHRVPPQPSLKQELLDRVHDAKLWAWINKQKTAFIYRNIHVTVVPHKTKRFLVTYQATNNKTLTYQRTEQL